MAIFAAMIASLSWTTIPDSHWSGPALWYAGIVFALTAVVLGAQQTILIPAEVDEKTACRLRERLESDTKDMPRQDMLFILQSPIMCLSLSVACFLAGLTSVVISPLARHPVWGMEAKVGLRQVLSLFRFIS